MPVHSGAASSGLAMGRVARWRLCSMGWVPTGWSSGRRSSAVPPSCPVAHRRRRGRDLRYRRVWASASAPVTLRYDTSEKIRQRRRKRNATAWHANCPIHQTADHSIQTAAATAQLRLDGDSGGARQALDQFAARHGDDHPAGSDAGSTRAGPWKPPAWWRPSRSSATRSGFRTGAKWNQTGGDSRKRVIGAWVGGSHFARRAGGFGERGPPRARLPCPRLARFCRGPHRTNRPRRRLRFDPATDSRGMGTANMSRAPRSLADVSNSSAAARRVPR